MPSECTLGQGPAHYWIGWVPVFAEYIANVIRKCNIKVYLMCPFYC